MTIQQNTDRIQTTHIGSLPRPHALLDVMKAKYTGQPYDRKQYDELLAEAVNEAVRKQVRMRHRHRHRRRILEARLLHLHPGTARRF